VGVEVRYFPYTVHTSSTVLRRALDALDAESLRRGDTRAARAAGLVGVPRQADSR
jgi:glycerol-3-phosphate cytidylyltransferase